MVSPKGGNNTGYAITVIIRSGRGRNVPTSSERRLVDDDQVMQEEEEIPNNIVQPNEEVRIDIDDSVEETQEEVNPFGTNARLCKVYEGSCDKEAADEFETIKVTHQVSAIVHSMAPKMDDPGAFVIPCTIGNAEFAKALCDLGDCEVDYDMPIILGRPFLATGKALCDVEAGELTFQVGDEKWCSMRAVLLNFDDDEMDDFMECLNSLQGMRSYNYAP
ncbi:uncharacterized protein [Nicotiana tomentosiformis]|uniref:uncharacterized protein n=1 Tax=Nicotiana tomentosiformis TaxID=4098 RepID=UPI00388CDBC4